MRWIPFALISAAVGFAMGAVAPRSWGFIPPYGILLGTAVYLSCFDGTRCDAGGRGFLEKLWRALGRMAMLLGLTALILYTRFGMGEPIDLTWPLATMVSWNLVESRLGRGGPRPRAARGGIGP